MLGAILKSAGLTAGTALDGPSSLAARRHTTWASVPAATGCSLTAKAALPALRTKSWRLAFSLVLSWNVSACSFGLLVLVLPSRSSELKLPPLDSPSTAQRQPSCLFWTFPSLSKIAPVPFPVPHMTYFWTSLSSWEPLLWRCSSLTLYKCSAQKGKSYYGLAVQSHASNSSLSPSSLETVEPISAVYLSIRILVITSCHSFFSWPPLVACGILVPCPGIKAVPPALGVQSLNHWTTREVPCLLLILSLLFTKISKSVFSPFPCDVELKPDLSR